MTFDQISTGDRYADSSGDYRVTYVARYVAWTVARVTPDGFRGTPGRREHEVTVHAESIALRNFTMTARGTETRSTSS